MHTQRKIALTAIATLRRGLPSTLAGKGQFYAGEECANVRGIIAQFFISVHIYNAEVCMNIAHKTFRPSPTALLNFIYTSADKSSLSWSTMRNERGNELGRKLNVIFFELLKLKKLLGTPVHKLNTREKWGLFLLFADKPQEHAYMQQLAETEEGIMNAQSALYEVSKDEKNWYWQNSIFKAQRDRNTALIIAEKRGAQQVVDRLLAQGKLSIAEIAELSGLAVEQVQAL